MLAWALCSGFRNGYDNAFYSTVYASSDIRYSSGGIGFFLFVTVTLWLIVIVFIVLGLLGLLEKLRIPMKMLIVSSHYFKHYVNVFLTIKGYHFQQWLKLCVAVNQVEAIFGG